MWASCVTKATKDGNARCARVATLCSKCRRKARPRSGRREIGLGMHTWTHAERAGMCTDRRTARRTPSGCKKVPPSGRKNPRKNRAGKGFPGQKKRPESGPEIWRTVICVLTKRSRFLGTVFGPGTRKRGASFPAPATAGGRRFSEPCSYSTGSQSFGRGRARS